MDFVSSSQSFHLQHSCAAGSQHISVGIRHISPPGIQVSWSASSIKRSSLSQCSVRLHYFLGFLLGYVLTLQMLSNKAADAISPGLLSAQELVLLGSDLTATGCPWTAKVHVLEPSHVFYVCHVTCWATDYQLVLGISNWLVIYLLRVFSVPAPTKASREVWTSFYFSVFQGDSPHDRICKRCLAAIYSSALAECNQLVQVSLTIASQLHSEWLLWFTCTSILRSPTFQGSKSSVHVPAPTSCNSVFPVMFASLWQTLGYIDIKGWIISSNNIALSCSSVSGVLSAASNHLQWYADTHFYSGPSLACAMNSASNSTWPRTKRTKD